MDFIADGPALLSSFSGFIKTTQLLIRVQTAYFKHIFYQRDFQLGEKCVKECENGLESCFIACGGDIDCMMSCNRDYAKCSDSCPCHTDCIDGCKNCDNPVCFCNGVVDENYDSCVSKNSLSLGKFHIGPYFWPRPWSCPDRPEFWTQLRVSNVCETMEANVFLNVTIVLIVKMTVSVVSKKITWTVHASKIVRLVVHVQFMIVIFRRKKLYWY